MSLVLMRDKWPTKPSLRSAQNCLEEKKGKKKVEMVSAPGRVWVHCGGLFCLVGERG